MMFVHFKKDTYEVVKVSPVAKPTDQLDILEIDKELGYKLVKGEEKLVHYLIFKYEDTYVFNKSQDVIDMFAETINHFALQELKIAGNEKAECSITLNKQTNQVAVRLNSFFNQPLHHFASFRLPSDRIPLYITKKNDPTYLLAILYPVVSDIIQQYNGECFFDIRPLPEEVSIYTKPIFKSYSLETA